MVGNKNNNNYASSVQGFANASFTQDGHYGTSVAPSAFVSRAGSFELRGQNKPVRSKLDISLLITRL